MTVDAAGRRDGAPCEAHAAIVERDGASWIALVEPGAPGAAAVAADVISRARDALAVASPSIEHGLRAIVAAAAGATDAALDVMLAVVAARAVDLAWIGGHRAWWIRGDRVIAQARPHCRGELDLQGPRRPRFRSPSALDRLRAVAGASALPPPFERLGLAWQLDPGDRVAIAGAAVWACLEDADVAAVVTRESPARALVDAAVAAGATGDLHASVIAGPITSHG